MSSALCCDDLEGWGMGADGERLKMEEIHVYLQLVHIVVPQKLTQHCRAINLQLTMNFKKNKVKQHKGVGKGDYERGGRREGRIFGNRKAIKINAEKEWIWKLQS